ncbi:MAG: arylsulfatase [Cytophagaceae bacterium SCN 52-12]|nr:MAG: arylsulfatase [Cytophagaceae bacterium SCN 52-12]
MAGNERANAVSPSDRPNFIIILCDNLGYGDTEPFGSKVNRTPHLSRMAKEGRRFTHFYVSSGVCTPSRASLMTGCYAQRVGLHWNDRDGAVLRPLSPYGLDIGEITIAEVLKTAGYRTGIIGKWHLGDHPDFLPVKQGFDYFYGIPYSDDMTRETGRKLGKRYDGDRWPELPLMVNEEIVEWGTDRNMLTRKYTEKALEYISENRNAPFFLYMPQAMPGSTTQPFSSDGFRGKSAGGPWGDSVEELDWSVGKIMDKLVELGISGNTIVIFTSDNGSPMGKDPESVEMGTNLPLHGRGYTTSEGGFRVPAIMWGPGRIPAGTTCYEMASTMDLLPTLSYLAGGTIGRATDGFNIWPLIEGKSGAVSPYDAFFYYEQQQLQAVRSGCWKLFLPLETFDRHPFFKKGQGDQPLLFNVVEDPGARHNLAADNPDVVRRLNELAGRGRKDLGDLGQPGENQRPAGKKKAFNYYKR